jgi:hypothetical protein
LDDPSHYAFDIFKQFGGMTQTTRAEFASLVDFAQHYRTLSPLHKQGVVLSQGYFSPNAGELLGPSPTSDYSPWVQMLDRWTDEFLTLVDTQGSSATKESLRWSQTASA